jgi:hypothetical protein
MRRGVLITALLWIMVLLCSGCIVPSQEAKRVADATAQNPRPPYPETKAEGGSLIKPTIPQEAAPTSQGLTTPGDGSVTPQHAQEMLGANPVNPFVEQPKLKDEQPKPNELSQVPVRPNAPAKQEWEDQKVRDAAVEMAKATPEVKKIKICYAVKEGEWWVTLYQAVPGLIELKPYIWNKDSERLEPHLVYRTIPISRLQQHLTEAEPGKACEVMEPPSTGPGGQTGGPGA